MVESDAMRWFVFAPLFGLIGLLPSTAEADSCADPLREPLRAAVLRVAHYPTQHALRAYLDLSSVPGAEVFDRGELIVQKLDDSQPAAQSPVDVRKAAAPGGVERILRLPDLASGRWELQARLATADCANIPGPSASFAVASFGWEGNRLGEDAGVIPPFTPLAVESDHVHAVSRDHTISGPGLWRQVTAAGQPLLAGPMRWVIVANGSPQRVEERPPTIRADAPDHVSVVSDLDVGPLSLHLEGSFEIDGLYRVRLRVNGDPGTRVDRLDLVIPLIPKHATLMNAITDETRIHRLGAVPDGDGTLWRSVDAARRQLDAGFVPYLWVGDEERGIAWLAESTRDFWFSAGDTVAELRRRAGQLELVIHFASTPGTLSREREIDFALQATPVKPRPSHAGSWRLWQLACDAGKGFVAVCPLPAGFYWGTASRYGHLTPRDGDEIVFDWMAQARAGRAVNPPIGEWLDRHGVTPEDRSEALASLEYTMRVLAIRPQITTIYMDSQGSAWGPDFEVYGDEWRAAPFSDRDGLDEPSARTLPTLPRSSYRDRLLWHLDRILAADAADGVFFDNAYLRASFDDFVGTAYRDELGRLHPGVEIYALRELFQRAQALVWKHRGGWWNVAHLTTTPISAIHGYAGINLDGEWRYGEDDFQDRFPRDLLRASALGSALGTIPVWLPGMLSATGPRREELRRQLFGLTALHEIRVMDSYTGSLGEWWQLLRTQGYGDPECQVARYWDADPIVTVTGLDAEALVIRCGRRLTALIVNFDDRGQAELGAAGAPNGWRCRDLERRWERLTSTGSSCTVRLARHDVRLIEMEPQ
jgi:hypothetical protein